jgi:transposase
MRSKGGQKHAIVCTARKLAIIYYTMVRNKVPFMPVNMDEYKEKQRKQQIATLEKKLAKSTNQAA